MTLPAAVDWIHLPGGTEPVSLWESLHDGELCAVHSDLLACTLRLEFEVQYLVSFHRLPQGLLFGFRFEGVRSARIVRWTAWPGEFHEPRSASYQERERLVAEYQAKCRIESESWREFESALTREDAPEISDAELAVGNDGQSPSVALKLGVSIPDGSYCELVVAAARLEDSRSDGEPLSLEEFRQLGNAYWEAFARRRSQADD